jgi:serine/threonine protein kinase
LVRLRTEFNRVLGRGRQFEVLGASSEFESFCSRISVEPAKLVQDQQFYAIKYALPPSASVSQNSSANSSFQDAGSRSFAAQLHSAKVEIQKLCLPSLCGHANIVKLLRWGICLDTLEDPTAHIPRIPLLILERATTDLQQFMRQSAPEQLSFDTRSQICLGVGHGLGALHTEGVYHGDLKLENVLMFQQENGWVAKLCDFGLSGTVDNGTLEYRGTDGWRPPESFDGSKLQSAVVIKCDIFVYGLLVWSVFTGKCDSPLRWLDLHGIADPEKFIHTASEQLVRYQHASNHEVFKLCSRSGILSRIFDLGPGMEVRESVAVFG